MSYIKIPGAFSYVVFLCYGDYEDKQRDLIGAFDDENDAKDFMHDESDRISHMMGVLSCVEKLHAEWQHANPRPVGKDGGSDWNSPEYEAWCVASEAAIKDIEKRLGYSEEGMPLDCGQTATHFFMCIVPVPKRKLGPIT